MLLHSQFSSGDECGGFLQLLSAAVELGSQWSVSWTHISSCRQVNGGGGRGASLGNKGPWFDLLGHIGRLETALTAAVGTCGRSFIKGWGCSSVGRASDRHVADAGSIPRCGKGFFSRRHLLVQTLLW